MKSHRSGLCRGGLFAVTWTIVASVNIAVAQTEAHPTLSSESRDASADRLFFEAKAKATERRWTEALSLFEEAWELKPSHDIAGNLGQVALKLGRYKKAATFLERCLRLFPPTGNAEQRMQIQSLFESARSHVAAVRIHVDPQPGELVIDRTNVLGPVSSNSEAIYVDPGTHVIQVRREGKIIGERTFMAVANATHDVNVRLDDNVRETTQPTPAALNMRANATPSQPLPVAERNGRSGVPIVIGATAAVIGFTSAALLLSAANGEVDTANRLIAKIGSPGRCNGTLNVADCTALHEANVRADTRYNWGHAMLGLGGAALLATVGYVLWPTASANHANAKTMPIFVDYEQGRASLSWVSRF